MTEGVHGDGCRERDCRMYCRCWCHGITTGRVDGTPPKEEKMTAHAYTMDALVEAIKADDHPDKYSSERIYTTLQFRAGGWHPDDDPEDIYVFTDRGDQMRLFDDKAAIFVKIASHAAFLDDVDVYGIARRAADAARERREIENQT